MIAFNKWHIYAVAFTVFAALVFWIEGIGQFRSFFLLLQQYNQQNTVVAQQNHWEKQYTQQVLSLQKLKKEQKNGSIQFLKATDKSVLLSLMSAENKYANIQEAEMRLGKLITDEKGYTFLPLVWKAKAGYHEVGNWLNGIALLPYAVMVKSIRLESNSNEINPLNAIVELAVPLQNE